MNQIPSRQQDPEESSWQPLLGQNASSPPVVPSTPGPPGEGSSGWALGESSYLHGSIVELRVVGYNRGGLLVDIGEVRGFVPASQLASMPRTMEDQARAQQLANYVGKTLRLKAIECNRETNRLVFSERVVSPPPARPDQPTLTLEQGQTYFGTIRNVTDFGAFIDLGGIEGLVHISELSWKHVNHPRDVVTPGQKVQVMVIDVDRRQKRIACSIKRLTQNPWALVAEKFKPGDWLDGTVTNVVSFGAFVKVDEGVEGLIHVSELASGTFLDPHTVVKEGQLVHARVLNIEPMRKRISLSLREASAASVGAADDAIPPEPDDGYWKSIADSE